MLSHNICNLIYVEEIKNKNNKEVTKNNVKYYEQSIYNSKYFDNLNRDVELGLSIRIRLSYLTRNLRFVEINNIRYKIERSTNIKGHWILLDLSELM